MIHEEARGPGFYFHGKTWERLTAERDDGHDRQQEFREGHRAPPDMWPGTRSCSARSVVSSGSGQTWGGLVIGFFTALRITALVTHYVGPIQTYFI